jgi:hypothetical protein
VVASILKHGRISLPKEIAREAEALKPKVRRYRRRKRRYRRYVF